MSRLSREPEACDYLCVPESGARHYFVTGSLGMSIHKGLVTRDGHGREMLVVYAAGDRFVPSGVFHNRAAAKRRAKKIGGVVFLIAKNPDGEIVELPI